MDCTMIFCVVLTGCIAFHHMLKVYYAGYVECTPMVIITMQKDDSPI